MTAGPLKRTLLWVVALLVALQVSAVVVGTLPRGDAFGAQPLLASGEPTPTPTPDNQTDGECQNTHCG